MAEKQETGDAHTRAQQHNVGDAMLGFYDCFADPGKIRNLMDTLGSWLSEESSDHNLLFFEQHSTKLWETVGDLAAKNIGETPVESPNNSFFLDENLKPLRSATNMDWLTALSPEDEQRLNLWRRSDQDLPLIVRNYALPEEPAAREKPLIGSHVPKFVVLHRVAEPNGASADTPAYSFQLPSLALDEAMEIIFKDTFDISRSEWSVLQCLTMGLKGPEIAEILDRKLNTIKTQIKGLYGKIGVSSSNDLMATVRLIEKQIDQRKSVDLTQRDGNLLHLADGSRIAFATYGPETGRPVLYIHGVLAGRHLPEAIVPMLRAANIRLIAFSRPGSGDSDLRADDEEEYLRQTTHNLAQIAKAFGCTCVPLIADGMGLIYALDFARTYPEKCMGILALDPIPPLQTEADLEQFVGRFHSVMTANFASRETVKVLVNLSYLDLKDVKTPKEFLQTHYFRGSEEPEPTTENDARARWNNVKDNLRTELRQVLFDADLIKTPFTYFAEGSNLRPSVFVFQTENSPYVTVEGVSRLAESLNAPIVNAGPTLPYIEGQMPLLIERLKALFDGG